MDQICRLCATELSEFTSIFSFNRGRLVNDMITIICPIKIDPADKFSKSICKKCLRIITESYELREISVHSDITFRSGNFQPQSQFTIIKQEKDTESSLTIFQDENFEQNYEESYSNEEELTPFNPKRKRTKYEKEKVKTGERSKCPLCEKSFLHPTNVTRHIKKDHNDDREGSNGSGRNMSTSCKICGAFISHIGNLKRHIKNNHPDSSLSFTEDDSHVESEQPQYIKSASELTKKYFGTYKKQKYMQFIEVVGEDGETSFTYSCIICTNEGKNDRCWTQSTQNQSASNIRRHLMKNHESVYEKFLAKETLES